ELAKVPTDRSFRVEHAELLDESDVPRFAAMDVVCSVQPCHLLTDIEALRRLVPDRLDRVLPFRELIDAGCAPGELLWFGSDAPIVHPEPQDSIDAATLRRRPGMPEADAIALGQALTESEAWAAFARG
ncbi:MAG: amidohydrolase family protein, partial [Planctomycetota bacterium]